MQPQLIFVLLAAAASARPLPELESSQIEALYAARSAAAHTHHTRELESSQIEALYAAREAEAGAHHTLKAREIDDSLEPRELESSQIESLYAHEDRHHAHDDAWQHHGPPHHGFEHYGPPPHHGHHGAHHGHHSHEDGPYNGDIIHNIIGFLTHQVRRSVPDASARVVDGILGFFAGEAR